MWEERILFIFFFFFLPKHLLKAYFDNISLRRECSITVMIFCDEHLRLTAHSDVVSLRKTWKMKNNI